MRDKKKGSTYACKGNEELLFAAAANNEAVLDLYGQTLFGYQQAEVDQSRANYGKNILTHHKTDGVIKRLFGAFINPFTMVLIVLALVSLFTDVLFIGPDDNPNPMAMIIVLGLVVISGTLKFVQETKSSNAAQKLGEMISTTTCVLRKDEKGASHKQEVPLSEIVVGDIVCLSAGDMVPADLRVLDCKDLFIRESSLTGESNPVEKFGESTEFGHRNSLELRNLAFAGSNVVSGSATTIVISIGDNTHLGSMATKLQFTKPTTNFEKGVNDVSKILLVFMAIMVPIVFLIIGLTQGDWLAAVLFGLAIAVGLTPEMLPMIVTTGLAKGAIKLSKKKTIVKNISAIQNFGAINILCTDKTGTLTEDQIVLEEYLNVKGQHDARVLRHALLNSYFQTGLKNLMDVAILNHSEDEDLAGVLSRYVKVDEIPFDFQRRRMSVVVKDDTGKTQLITKGAIEEMLRACSYVDLGEVILLNDQIKQDIIANVARLNNEGMRVLGVAHKTNPAPVGEFSTSDEVDMVLLGYLAFLDPPKESAYESIMALKENGVEVKILTGDNLNVTRCIAAKVGIDNEHCLLGTEIEAMTDDELSAVILQTTIFAKLSPQQKVRVVATLRAHDNVVGFLGDGINDAAAIREADVGLSVDTAVDIAKESADIILLEKDLRILTNGVIEGRKTFVNILKYIKMTTSSNFGNILSVLVAAIFLPFLPLLPLQILVLNLIYDVSCVAIPWDNVDHELIKKPKKWHSKSIVRFMLSFGPVSSILDITSFAVMFFLIIPSIVGAYGTLAVDSAQWVQFIAYFHAGWFMISLGTQLMVIHFIRTPKIPFIQSRPPWLLIGSTILGLAVGLTLIFTPMINDQLGLIYLTWQFVVLFLSVLVTYIILISLVKWLYIKVNKELL